MAAIALEDVVVHRIVEQESPFMAVRQFAPAITTEQLDAHRHWLEPAALVPGTDEVVLCIQSYLIRTPRHTILVDACVGNDKDRPAFPSWHRRRDATWLEALAAAGASPESIDYVLCTHLHSDHVGWNTIRRDGRWVPTFPNARYVFSAIDVGAAEAQHAASPLPAYADSVLPVIAAGQAELVSGEHAVGDHLRLLPTPGHTPGHSSVRIGRARDLAVVSGDLIHWPLQLRYPELATRFDADPAQAAVTRRSFLERWCGTETLFCSSHFPSPSTGWIERQDDGFRLRTS